MSNVADKVKDVALDEVHRIEKLTNEAARSGAYLYPLRVNIRPKIYLPHLLTAKYKLTCHC